MSHVSAVRDLTKATQKVLREIDSEIARVQREADREIARLRAERQRYASLVDAPKRRRPGLSSAAIAGPAAIATVEAFLAEHGTAFQADITTATGLNSGTVTHALRHLAGEGKILMTGEKRRNSPEVTYLAAREAVAA